MNVNAQGYPIGETHHRATYTDHECDLVHELRESGLGYKRIAKLTGIPRSTVRAICTGRIRSQAVSGVRSVKGGT